ncbi:MAG: DNA alkylation repair protein [Candidatus Marinimicrobia bacterium]|nr:DNA alkylation repair protein [Candidatus Neomarinimicrobiota bacterium]MCF7839351.1 DNA alkylation repair protein [Candidatus Neomarinimicrobiota bacterium]MCF7901954.1 DNA alkylation repair protein [Candidatus Neomarinimicrobiota bacterium]
MSIPLKIQLLVRKELQHRADPAKAPKMQQYVKSPLPFYGVQSAGQKEVWRIVRQNFPVLNWNDYEETVKTLWFQAEQHEEKYLAISILNGYPKLRIPRAMSLYETLLVSCWNWDLLDGIAGGSVGRLLIKDPSLESWLVKWSQSDNFWMRRAAIIGQLNLKERTNAPLLFSFCEKMAHEKEFFIRKAIGWALRQYARTNPVAVKAFVEKMEDRLSGLSRREALKHLT